MLGQVRSETHFRACKGPWVGRRGCRDSAVVKAAGIILASDGQVSDDHMHETALLVADAIHDAAVVALSSARKESPFAQLESSVGSTVDAVRCLSAPG